MANCVLCGKKIGLLDQIKEDFYGTKQIFCSDCSLRLQKASPQERNDLNQQILASPDLADEAIIQANLDARKTCPACGTLMDRKIQDFSIGADGGGGLMPLLSDQYVVDLYACPQCGKVELYTARFVPPAPVNEPAPQEEAPQEEAPQPQETVREERGFRFPWQKREKPPWEG